MTYFTDEQVNLLLRPIHPRRVLMRDGMSYVEGYDIKAELNRVFGFGRWSVDILSQDLICETETKTRNNKDAWYVVYKTSLRLTVCAPDGAAVARYEESHVGESTHPVRGEAHGNALTNSWTYALKRCASNLGDQFGLSLYGKGSMDALVRWTLVRPEAGAEAGATDTDDVPQVSAEGTESPAPAEDESAADAFENATAALADPQTAQVADVPADDLWVTHPEPAADEAWLNGALEAAPKLATLDACTVMWRKSAEKVRDESITREDARRLQVILRARMETLKTGAALDADDPWALKVADISELMEAEAALRELADLLSSGGVDEPRYKAIAAAIDARLAEVEKRAAGVAA